ncbi:hypothetical protein PGB90_009460 [Kerria lacca]
MYFSFGCKKNVSLPLVDSSSLGLDDHTQYAPHFGTKLRSGMKYSTLEKCDKAGKSNAKKE